MLNGTPQTLIADDQPDVLEALRLLLKPEGYQVEAANSPKAVLEKLASRQFDVLLMDLNYARDTTSGQEGLDLLARIQRLDSTLPIVVMTAWANIPLAVEAMRRGARDFVQKPWENAQLLSTLRHQIEAGYTERSSVRQEIEEAKATQRGLLPREIPHFPDCRIAVSWQPARDVSGDYLDVLRLGGGRLALAIGDVIGKGVPAALLMSNLQAAVRALAPEVASTNQLATRVNRLVASNTRSGKFITFFYGVLDSDKTLTYTNAGHSEPVLVRRDGEPSRLNHGDAVLGVFPDWTYTEFRMKLRAGDRLLLFTDGITEAENAHGEPFGEDRLADLLAAHRRLDAEGIRRTIMSELAAFTAGQLQDDATLVVLAVE